MRKFHIFVGVGVHENEGWPGREIEKENVSVMCKWESDRGEESERKKSWYQIGFKSKILSQFVIRIWIIVTK